MALGGNGLNLRCALSECRTMQVTVPSPGVSAGDFYKSGDVVGVWLNDYDTGDTGVLIYKARSIIVTSVAVTTSVNFAVGEPVYYDVADAEVNQSTSGNYLCGVVLTQPSVGDEEVEIELDGTLNVTRGT